MSAVVYRDLSDSLCGFFDAGTGQITINRKLPGRRRRSSFIHETYHRDLNHGPAKSLAETVARELTVERMTARFQIPFPELMRVMSQTTDLAVAADRLDVDLSVMLARLTGMDADERLIFDVCVRQCIRVKSAAALAAVSHVMSMAPSR